MSFMKVEEVLEANGLCVQEKMVPCWQEYLELKQQVYEAILPNQVDAILISEANWILRSQYENGSKIGMDVEMGDICYMDYGQAYLNEMGYQHFGLVLSVFQQKALVIPLSSNPVQYENAYDPLKTSDGKKHLMRLGQIEGLTKPSFLYLNDLRFINTARVIEVCAHLDVDSVLFRRIQLRVMALLFSQ